MGRPKQPIIRDQQLNLSLTRPELDHVKSRAEAAGMRLVDYGRAMLLSRQGASAQPVATVNVTERLIFAQLARLGNNLNQLVRHLHITQGPVPSSLEPLLAEIRRVLERRRP